MLKMIRIVFKQIITTVKVKYLKLIYKYVKRLIYLTKIKLELHLFFVFE